MRIADAAPIDNRIRKANKEDFHHAKETPPPGALSESILFINNSDRRAIRLWWGLQADRAGDLVEDIAETQSIRDARTPACIASESGKLNTSPPPYRCR